MALERIDFSTFAATVQLIGRLEDQAKTQQRGKIDLTQAKNCGVLLSGLGKNGAFERLAPEDHARLRQGATRIGRSYRNNIALRKLLIEIGEDLQRLGNVTTLERARAKTFCNGAISNRT